MMIGMLDQRWFGEQPVEDAVIASQGINRDVLVKASTTCPTEAAPIPITDTAYDDLDRAFRSTQYVPAADGGNRVTETVYNADDTVQIVKKAVGTALAQNYVTYTYTPNGSVDTSKDAKNNLTVYLYDGFDRLGRTHYPLPGDNVIFGYDLRGLHTAAPYANGSHIITTCVWDLRRAAAQYDRGQQDRGEPVCPHR